MRRVWGTLKHTPAGAVVATLKKLTTIGEQLTVKRVFRSGIANSRDRWWFHLLGSEDLLKQLEGEWESVLLQTKWKLELCTKPATNDTNTSHSSPTVSPEQPDDPNSPGSTTITRQLLPENSSDQEASIDTIATTSTDATPNHSQVPTNLVPSPNKNHPSNSHSFLEITQVTHSPPPST